MGIPKNVEVSSSQYWVSDSWVIGLLLLFKDVKLISLLCSKIERYTTLFMIIKPAYWFCSVYGLLVLLLRVIVVASCCRLPHVVLAAAATQGGCKNLTSATVRRHSSWVSARWQSHIRSVVSCYPFRQQGPQSQSRTVPSSFVCNQTANICIFAAINGDVHMAASGKCECANMWVAQIWDESLPRLFGKVCHLRGSVCIRVRPFLYLCICKRCIRICACICICRQCARRKTIANLRWRCSRSSSLQWNLT